MNLPPSPTPVSVSPKWELASSNWRPNPQGMLEKRFDGFRQEVCPDGSCRCDHHVAEENDMVVGPLASQRSYVELLQNCDLPPPVKFFTGEKETALRTVTYVQPSPPIRKMVEADELGQGLIDDRLGLLKALHLSQKRAREAEKKASLISIEKDNLTTLFFKESSKLFSHRQLRKLLEIEILQLKARLTLSDSNTTKKQSGENRDDGDGGSAWYIASALCLGLAGVGIALSCRWLF